MILSSSREFTSVFQIRLNARDLNLIYTSIRLLLNLNAGFFFVFVHYITSKSLRLQSSSALTPSTTISTRRDHCSTFETLIFRTSITTRATHFPINLFSVRLQDKAYNEGFRSPSWNLPKQQKHHQHRHTHTYTLRWARAEMPVTGVIP